MAKTRHQQVLEALCERHLTAREVSDYLYNSGYTAVRERNIAHPRLNELVKQGLVEVFGYTYDSVTKKDVKVYKRIIGGTKQLWLKMY